MVDIIGQTVQYDLHYIDTGTGDTVVFIHGFSAYWFAFIRQIQSLKKDYRAVAIDGLGAGRSGAPGRNLHRLFGQEALHCRDGSAAGRSLRMLALCDIHNPQNLGMIIRSACAGGLDRILLPRKGCAPLSLFAHKPQGPVVYILGNESEGIGADVFNLDVPLSQRFNALRVSTPAAITK